MAIGAPDYSRDVNLRGWNGEALRAVKVDDLGRIVAMLNALYGTTPTPLKCDNEGQIQINLNAQGLPRVVTYAKPPPDVTSVFKTGTAENATQVIHTVPAGKTLYVTAIGLMVSSMESAGWAYLAARDEADVIQYYWGRTYIRSYTYCESWDGGCDETDVGIGCWGGYGCAGGPGNVAMALPLLPPFPVAEGWDIIIHSGQVRLITSGSINGWEE